LVVTCFSSAFHCPETTRQFEIAFKMIDVDGSDFIDLNEFSRVCECVLVL